MKFINKARQERFNRVDPLVKYQMKQRFYLAETLDEIFKKTGKTQKEIADILGKNESEISKWLTGFHHFSEDTLSRIEFYLGVKIYRHPPEHIVFFSPKSTPNLETIQVKIEESDVEKFKNEMDYAYVSEAQSSFSLMKNN